MNDAERKLVFDSAMDDYRAGLHGVAARSLRQLVEDGSDDPMHLSYCGLLAATTEASYDDAVSLCRQAVALGRRPAELYLNLANVLEMAGRRRETVEALVLGLSVHPENERLRRELQHRVPRRRPAFRFLSRRHPLNKYVGIARTVSRRLWVTFIPQVRRVPRRKGETR